MKQILRLVLISVIAVKPYASFAETSNLDSSQQLQLNVGQTKLWLEDHNGTCHAIASTEQGSTAQHVLGIPWPCHFHTDRTGNIRTLQEGGYVYALVESSRRVAQLSHDCETYLQSIRVRGASIEVSQHKDRVASCPPFQWDSVLFKELFN